MGLGQDICETGGGAASVACGVRVQTPRLVPTRCLVYRVPLYALWDVHIP